MPRETRVVLLTGDGRRHRFVAAELARAVDLVAVLSEAKYSPLAAAADASPDDAAVIRRHLDERDDVERRLLGEAPRFPDTAVRHAPHGTVNDPDVAAWVERHDPDVVALFGTGLVKAPLLDRYGDRMVNLHLGLSPYYRGSGTNFWPLVNGEPECVGATIHMAVARVDAGAVLAQARPELEPRDRAHEIGTKAMVAGAAALARALALGADGWAAAQPQDLARGRVYRRRDFDAAAVRQLWRNLDDGMVPAYLADGRARRAAYPIVDAAAAAAGA